MKHSKSKLLIESNFHERFFHEGICEWSAKAAGSRCHQCLVIIINSAQLADRHQLNRMREREREREHIMMMK